MLKKFNIILLVILLLTGCRIIDKTVEKLYMGSVYNMRIDNQINILGLYCEINNFNHCISYRQCVSDSYQEMRGFDTIKQVIINGFFLPRVDVIDNSYNKEEYIGLLDKLYKELDKYNERFEYKKAIYGMSYPMVSSLSYPMEMVVSLGYLIHTHNSCAPIIGDNIYDIDKYMPLIKENLEME